MTSINSSDEIDEIVKARRFLESRGLCVMDLRLAPHPVDPTAPDAQVSEGPYIYNHKNKFEVGQNGEPIGYLPMRIVWIISVGMMAFGIGIANRLS